MDKSFSQNQDLIQSNWYLTELIMNGDSYFPPTSDVTLPYIQLNFNPSGNTYIIYTAVCNTVMSEAITFSNNETTFSYLGASATLITCQNSSNDVIDSFYASFFFNLNPQEAKTLNYSINEVNELMMMTLTDENGNQAIYSSMHLKTQSNSKNDISLWPNPTKDLVNISAERSPIAGHLEIINAFGQKIERHSFEVLPNSIDLSSFPSGIYFISIENQEEKNFFKIIKK
jgi:hypothetical protein